MTKKILAFQKINSVLKHMSFHDRFKFIEKLQKHLELLKEVLKNIDLKTQKFSINKIEQDERQAIKGVIDSIND